MSLGSQDASSILEASKLISGLIMDRVEQEGDSAYAGATYQAHWYVYPLTYLLNIIIDSTCKDSQGSISHI